MRLFIINFIFIFFNFIFFVSAQNSELYINKIYDDNIRTVTFNLQNSKSNYPIINLLGNEKLVLEFDDLYKDTKDYSYTIIHCNADWTASELNQLEYISGFAEDELHDYEMSFSTLVKYNHYRLIFPNENMSPSLSGNYILIVYNDYDIENKVLSRRFKVVNEKVEIEGKIKRSTIVTTLKQSQEISFNIIDKQSIIDNPFDNLYVTIVQNNRCDNMLENIKPDFIKGNVLEFYNPRKLNFTGGNEYRYFNVKNHKYLTDKIAEISYQEPYYFFKLLEDKDESRFPYSFVHDLNGDFFITADNVDDYGLECDYVYVDFSLRYVTPLEEGNFYVFGAISDWQISKKNKMNYNYGSKCYELRMLLKQGFYNYEYVFAENENADIDNTIVEGSHSETENNYVIYVYYRKSGSQYDELIGTKIINSLKKL